jgi:Concanavalin A-like lectin/glucanases superfamily/Calx-beta domain/Right handed beta helix region
VITLCKKASSLYNDSGVSCSILMAKYFKGSAEVETMRKTTNTLAVILMVVVSSVLGGHAWATDYYVDFDGGLDGNNGTTTSTAWKYAPGDPAATGNPASVSLQAGDNVIFKGGVFYRGNIVINADGTAGNDISYTGNSWGPDKAIIDGSEILPGSWTQCTSAAQCGDNPNWANIYYIDAPVGHNFFTQIFEDDDYLWYSQDPNPERPLFYEKTRAFRDIPLGDASIVLTQTTLKDPRIFTQADPNFWDGAYIAVWVIPNVVVIKPVVGYDPATNTLQFEAISNSLYTDRDSKYCILNHTTLIDTEGEYAYSDNKIFAWLRNPGVSTANICTRKRGIDVSGHDNITIEGFRVQKFFGELGEYYYGVGILCRHTSDTSYNVTIRDNDLVNLCAAQKSGALYLCVNVDNATVENNTITMCKNRGILALGNHVIVRNNLVETITGTGMLFMQFVNGQIIGNSIIDTDGTHANGMSVYENSSDVLVARNYIYDSPTRSFTFAKSHNLTVFGNVFYGNSDLDDGEGGVLEAQTLSSGQIAFLNNVILTGKGNCQALPIGGKGANEYVAINNILDGGPTEVVTRSHNIYVGLRWNQTASYGWYPAEGEFVEEDWNALFILPTPQGGNFHLKTGSPAINAGTNIAQYLPVSEFPDFDFGVDIDGHALPQGGIWDVGYDEYVSGIADSTPPSTPQDLVALTQSSTQINLSWTPSTDNVAVSGYKIFRGGLQVDVSSSAGYSDTGLTASTPHSYQVLAYDFDGNESGLSSSAGDTTDAPPPPELSISNASVTEGNSGTVNAVFSVALSSPASQQVTVDYNTSDDSATVGDGDYVTASGTVTFPTGSTLQTVSITVVGDTDIESSESFQVNMSNASGAPIVGSQGIGTIQDDDSPVDANLMAHWKLDDASGTTAADSSGNGNTGTLTNGPGWTMGHLGGALSFDGVDDFANMGTGSLNFSNQLTLACWVYPTGAASEGYQVIMTRNRYTYPFRMRLRKDTGRVETFVRTGNGTNMLTTNTVFSINQWYHIALTYESGTRVIYINGVVDNSNTHSGTLNIDGSPTLLGAHESGEHFSGYLDDVRVYNRALSSTEIQALYTAEPPATPPPAPVDLVVDHQ